MKRLVMYMYEELHNVFHGDAMTPVEAQDSDGHSEMVLPGDGMLGGNENAQQETDKNCSKELVIGT